MERELNLISHDEIPEKLKTLRNKKGITQKELGQKIDLTPSQISRIENGRANPSYKRIYKVFDELRSVEVTVVLEDKKVTVRAEINLSYSHEFVKEHIVNLAYSCVLDHYVDEIENGRCVKSAEITQTKPL